MIDDPKMLVFFIPHMLFALSVHEASHAYSAFRLGDDTASLAGRVTLNPLKHLDFLGVMAFFVIGFGWAKPVPVNPLRLKDPRKGDLLVSLAGPASNLLTGLVLLFGILGLHLFGEMEQGSMTAMAFLLIGAQLNIGLCFFNLLPIPPLDGSHVLMGVLPGRQAEKLAPYMSQGAFVLIGLILLSSFFEVRVFDYLIWAPLEFVVSGFLGKEAYLEALFSLQSYLG